MRMKANKKFILAASAGILALSASVADADEGQKAQQEKCYGVVAKGMNDCATASHSCAGQASADNQSTEWLYIPAGLCDRIAGGAKEPKKS